LKLRIKGNSLRLRLTRSELERFALGDRIEETIQFSSAEHAKLTYALESSTGLKAVSVRYLPQDVTVILPEEQVLIWSDVNNVGVYANVDIGEAGVLEIAVEKDFACLDGSDEDNRDTFANPHAGSMC